MFLTNNDRTVFNLILYSEEVYTERNSKFKTWGYISYYSGHCHNIKPYGNINKGEFFLLKKERISNVFD